MKKIILYSFSIVLLLCSCRGSKSPTDNLDADSDFDYNTSAPERTFTPVINVYIENTGSMDGYVYGITEFKGAIRNLLVMLRHRYSPESINLFFINTAIHSYTTAINLDIANFANSINSHWRIGNRSTSDLNQMFTMILDNTDDNTISILLSDFIYSIPALGNTVDQLNNSKSSTQDAFLTKWRSDNVPLATTILAMNSRFNGRYFPYTGDSNWFFIFSSDENSRSFPGDRQRFFINQRPYYVCVIANQPVLEDFNRKIDLETLEGYENKYMLTPESSENTYWSVLKSSFNRGRFDIDRSKSGRQHIHGIEKAKALSRGGCSRGKEEPFSFAIAVDFSNIETQTEKKYVLNAWNYEVISNNFEIVTIFEFNDNDIHPNDRERMKNQNPTHIIQFEATTALLHNTALRFALKKQMPEWVAENNAEDDTTIENLTGKTFGLKYWVEGIAEAYEIIYPDNKYYFECSISIK